MRGGAGAPFPARAAGGVRRLRRRRHRLWRPWAWPWRPGADLDEAVEFALLASGVVVEKVGTAVVTPDELIEAELAPRIAPRPKPRSPPSSAWLRARPRAGARAGLKVGFTNGCFDILHRGHVAYLAQARAWCDRLIVGLNSDASVRGAEGRGPAGQRPGGPGPGAGGPGRVDLVAPFDEDTPIELIEAVRPDVLIKGARLHGGRRWSARDLVQS